MPAHFYTYATFIVMLAIVAAFAAIVLVKVARADLTALICEIRPDGSEGKPSLSRFQMLLFSFLVGGLFVVLSLESGTMIDIPNGALALMGISGGSFLISKGIGGPKDPTA